MGSLAAVFKSNLHVKNVNVVHLEKGDSQFGTVRLITVPPPTPLTPSNTLYDESFRAYANRYDEMHVCVGGSGQWGAAER